jgi:hypothetical protein
MFVGCAALSYCPKSLLVRGREDAPADPESGTELSTPHDDTEPPAYRSAFQNWDTRAGVRAAPRRVVAAADAALRFFSPDLVPVARHPLVRALPGPVFDTLLVQHLYRYLDFTAKLEYLVVNRTVIGIAHGSVDVPVPESMRFDALKMYCDEAYHALAAVDLRRQVEQVTGAAARVPHEPYFLRRLQQILAELPAEQRGLAELMFVIISETLISASLAEIPDSDDLVPAVRESIRDHALDEGRHHAYFAVFLRHLWGALDPARRRLAGRLAPRLMDAFLHPDLESMRTELVGHGMSKDLAEQVLGEVYTPAVLSRQMRATSRLTRRYLDELGAFDDPQAAAELHTYGYAP